ncbi:pimeloyl-ACP methyl ester carboxylesterase [Albidovulum inexpectatum]|uniref:Pimeloyl-ACP methyl ester carboxylesterase n=1 Tax=Albidovulum inexpectatum TaxID=196587 RepID=A0A2S5JLL2_9RHOB|nr:alpha/beta hydrolase [Albidovulum inexpectatum]PPB82291.1 pimeloyl-ACP methyl ester carboxylesterase [Albidovulum inexpectatum]
MTLHYFTASDGARLAWRDDGAGPPVLCLAGLTRSGRDFDFLVPHLVHRFRMIRPDYRGRGDSEWTGGATYTVEREARDVLELMDHLGIDRAAIIGTSRGGLIGMALAAGAHGRMAGLCLNDIGPVIERAGLERIKDYVGRNPAARSLDEIARKLPAAMPEFRNVPPERWRAFAERQYEETPQGLRIRYDPELRQSFLQAFSAPPADLWPLFDACAGLPLALIRGANSDLLSPETVAAMRARRPDMIVAEVPDRGHVPFLDEPEALAAIDAWLEATWTSA